MLVQMSLETRAGKSLVISISSHIKNIFGLQETKRNQLLNPLPYLCGNGPLPNLLSPPPLKEQHSYLGGNGYLSTMEPKHPKK